MISNIVHASDSEESADREIQIWFASKMDGQIQSDLAKGDCYRGVQKSMQKVM